MPLFVGHRGAKNLEPENTLRSIRKAIECGADGIEIDVRKTRDGKLVIIHDATLERTTNGKGFVKDYTLLELRRLDCGKGERIPTLEEALAEINGKAFVQVELKEEDCEPELLKALEKSPAKKVQVISFNHNVVERVKRLKPEMECGVILVGLPVKLVNVLGEARADFACMRIEYASKQVAEELHAAGKKLCVWPADSKEEIKKLVGMGCDVIVSNRPDLFAEFK